MARKKIVFVIVEGPSEETALGILLNKIFDTNSVYVKIWHGDVTSAPGVNMSNVVSKIGDVITQYANANHYSKEHFQEIIHLIDTDGAYISEENVVQDDSAVDPIYTLSEIHTDKREEILARNKRKSGNMDKLSACKMIWSIPYRAYYMSCNLDHVLYGKQNSSDDEKEDDSYKFAKEYKNKIPEFIQFISESDFSVKEDYKESWDFIRKEKHSLERYTNFGLALKNNIESNV